MRDQIGRTHRPYAIGTQLQAAAFNSLLAAPSLDLDFLSGRLDPRITFTRTTSATFVNSLGYVESAAIDVPRFTHDPVTRQPLGLLVEQGITNLACGSETFATSGGANNWADTNITRDSTNNQDPANGTTALRVTASSGNATILNNLSLSSASRTFSVWLRRVGGTGNVEMTMDGGTTWTAQSITSSWSRYFITATTTAHVGIRVVSSGDSIELWGAQVEALAYVTSYIPTTTATIARGQDNVSMTGDNFSSWFNESAGTIFVSFQRMPAGSVAGSSVAFHIDDGGNNNRTYAIAAGGLSGSTASSVTINGGSVQATFSYTGVDGRLPTKIAHAYARNSFAGCYNGASVLIDNVGTPPVVNQMFIGSLRSTLFLKTAIARLSYWPIRLPNETLRTLTT